MGKMNKKVFILLYVIAISFSGCAFHEHKYIEEVIKEPTCKEEGIVEYTCRCGESYTESIPLKHHEFGEYVYDNNANFKMDGTETAKCIFCGLKTSRKVEGTKLKRETIEMNEFLFLKAGASARREKDNVRYYYPKNYAINATCITSDGYFSYKDYQNNTLWIRVEDVLPPTSRDISDYRTISSLAELKKYDDWDFDWFCANFTDIEKVVYLQGDYYYLLYDYCWNDNGTPQMIVYYFKDVYPWRICTKGNFNSGDAMGSYHSYQEERPPIEWFELYKSLTESDKE